MPKPLHTLSPSIPTMDPQAAMHAAQQQAAHQAQQAQQQAQLAGQGQTVAEAGAPTGAGPDVQMHQIGASDGVQQGQPQVVLADPSQVAALIQTASQAAHSAAQAVQQMSSATQRAASDRQFAGYSDASKVLRYPEGFGGNDSHESDVAKWQEFAHSFKSWLIYAEPEYGEELATIETSPHVVVTIADMVESTKPRARRLYAILSGLLKGRPLVILRSIPEQNGFELWRQLQSVYAPRTRARSLALLSAYMSYPAFTKDKSFREQVNALERVSDEYRKVSGSAIGADVQMGVLVRVLPNHLRQHIQLQMTESSSYDTIREAVMNYESVTTTWSNSRVHLELGTSNAADPNGPAPMDISRVNEETKGGKRGKMVSAASMEMVKMAKRAEAAKVAGVNGVQANEEARTTKRVKEGLRELRRVRKVGVSRVHQVDQAKAKVVTHACTVVNPATGSVIAPS